jgi:hypothetical protein
MEASPLLSSTPAQFDLHRYVGQKIPQARLDDVEHMAFDTYTGPQFTKWLQDGAGLKGGPLWYLTRGTQQKAMDALGDVAGPEAFRDMIRKMASVTAMSRPDNNLRRGSMWRAADLAGLLDPAELRAKTPKFPQGFGHIAQIAHRKGMARMLEEGGINPFINPKPAAFEQNLNLNWRPYTNDSRMSTYTKIAEPRLAHAFAGDSPRNWAYAPMERAAQRAAQVHAQSGLLGDVPEGLDPTALFQAQGWGGMIPTEHGGSFDDTFDKLLNRTAKKWKMSPTKANELVWRGNPFDLPLNTPILRR